MTKDDKVSTLQVAQNQPPYAESGRSQGDGRASPQGKVAGSNPALEHLSSNERVPDNGKVICPECCHQFYAICVNDQQERSADQAEIERLRGELAITKRDRDTLLEMTGTTIQQVARRIEKLRGTPAEIRAAETENSNG